MLLIREKRLGYFLVPMMLVFALITNVNIISLTLVTMAKSGANGLPQVGEFTVLSLICLFFIAIYLRNVNMA